MKNIVFTLMFLLCVSGTYSQWISNYGFSKSDINFTNAKGNAVTTDAYGYSYVTGFSYEAGSERDIVTIKYTATGDTVWARSYNGTSSLNDEGNGICVDGNGNVYVVGYAQYNGKSFDVVILQYSADGTEIWAKQYASTELALMDKGLAIAVNADGFIYITGYTTNTDGYKDIFVSKYNSDGAVWTALEDGPFDLNAEGLSIAVSSAGNVFVTGYVSTTVSNTEMVVLKYNESGNQEWMKFYEGPGYSEDKAWGIVVDAADNCYITGYITVDANNTDCLTAVYDSEGNLIWYDNYNGGGNQIDKAWGIVVDTDGSVYITGETTDAYLNINYITIKYSTTGVRLWEEEYNGTGSGEDVASAIGIVGTNSLVVTGKSWGTSATYDYATVRYNKDTGNQSQVSIYSFTGNSDDMAEDIAITLTSKVIITGISQLIIDNAVDQSYISTLSMDWGSEMLSDPIIPNNFSLYQNYPNPFNPSTSIKFDLRAASKVKLAVYDMLGREVNVLVNQYLDAGTHNISFNAGNLASGIYFYRLQTPSFSDVKKMTLVK